MPYKNLTRLRRRRNHKSPPTVSKRKTSVPTRIPAIALRDNPREVVVGPTMIVVWGTNTVETTPFVVMTVECPGCVDCNSPGWIVGVLLPPM